MTQRPTFNDDYEQVEQKTIPLEDNRGRLRLTLLASKTERKWAVYGEVVAPVGDHSDKDEYTPRHEYYYLSNKGRIPDYVRGLILEMTREAKRYQRSVDSDAAAMFRTAVSGAK